MTMTCAERPEELNPLLPWHFAMYLCGGVSSGKSSLIFGNLLSRKSFYRNVFDKVFVFSPSIHTVGKKIDLPPDRFVSGYDKERLEQIIEEQEADDEDRVLIVFDDLISSLKKDAKEMLRMIYNRRHLNISIIITSQKYNKLPLELRTAMSHVALFRVPNKEMAVAHEELSNLSRDDFDAIAEYAWNKNKKGFLWIDLDKPDETRYSANFERIRFGR